MGMQRVKQDFWIQTIRECKQSGQTVVQYCKDNNLSEKSYWYYHKKYGDVLEEAMKTEARELVYTPACRFAELSAPVATPATPVIDSTAVLHKNGIRVELNESISDDFLIRLLKVLSDA